MGDLKSEAIHSDETRFGGVPIEITISVGTAKPLVKDLMALDEETVLPLDRSLDDPVDLYVGERLIARGQLEELQGEGSGRLGVRIIEVIAVPPRP